MKSVYFAATSNDVSLYFYYIIFSNSISEFDNQRTSYAPGSPFSVLLSTL